MSNEATNETQTVLANAIDVASKVVTRIAGTTIGSSINGQQIEPSLLNATIAARLQAQFAKHMGVAQ